MITARFSSIGWKLGAAFGVLILAAVVFQMTYFPARQAGQATEALVVKAQSVTSLVSHDILAAFEFGDAGAVKEVFKGAEDDPDLRFLVLFDRSGKVFSSAERGGNLPAVQPLPEGSGNKQAFVGSFLTVSHRVSTQGGTTGTLVAGFSTDRIAAERRRNQLTAIPIGLAVLLPGLAVTLLISRYVARRLSRLGYLAERVADGDLTISIGGNETTGSEDEIGRVTRAFDLMASSLKATIQKVIHSEAALRAVSGNVSARSADMIVKVGQQRTALDGAYETVDRLNSAIQEISQNADRLKTVAEETSAAILEMVASQSEIAQRAENLGESVGETSAATTEMVSAIKEVDRNIDYLRGFVTDTSASVAQMNASIAEVESSAASSYKLAQTVAEAAEAGRAAVKETIDGMERARGASVRTNDVVKRLGERSAEIGQILTVIQSITDQTNLLALNAAILAAQAGVHGAGFSVVADEIRDLSDRTTASTKDISALIQSVQTEVREALQATAEGSQIVEQAARLSVSAGEKLSAILESSGQSLDMGRRIASTTREQAQGSQTIGESISRLDDLVRQISAAMSAQATGSTHIIKALETMRDVTSHARSATAEQQLTSTRIASAADTVMAMSQKIRALIGDHVSQSGRIVSAMGEVRTIADGNQESAAQMSESVDGLGQAIRSLNEEVRKFRIDA